MSKRGEKVTDVPDDDAVVTLSPEENETDNTHSYAIPTPEPAQATKYQARLVVLVGEHIGRTTVLGDETTLGRSATCQVQLNDHLVSRQHTVIRKKEDDIYEIEDLGSSNGTIVNGLPVFHKILNFGDRVQVGRHILLFTYHDPLQQQILQIQKLESLGRLGAGIAHDLNNVLSVVIATTDYLKKIKRDNVIGESDIQECIDDIRTAADRATDFTRRLLCFSRRDESSHSIVNISDLCEDVVQIVKHTFSQNIEIRRAIQPNLKLFGNHGEIHQLVLNLCINARDAMQTGGRFALIAESVPSSELLGIMDTVHSSYIVISVIDTGTGIDEETKKRIFEPFFTTKGRNSGSGLGLAMVYEFATLHGGTVTVQSNQKQGTVFKVYLPQISEEDETTLRRTMTAELTQETEIVVRQTGLVLVVDDDLLVRKSTGRLLTQTGFSVQFARDGEEAIRYMESCEQFPDIILLDIDLPKLDGFETLRKLRDINPSAKVVFISGTSGKEMQKKVEKHNVHGFLAKPYGSTALLSLVSGLKDAKFSRRP